MPASDVLLLYILVFQGILFMVAVSNQASLLRLPQSPDLRDVPLVSILVPARDEAHNIEPCLRSLQLQDYPNFEIFVLDDHSRDDTAAILHRMQAEFPTLNVLHGRPLPDGWLGKHWACQQLAEAAQGELFLFTDADTRHAPGTLSQAVAALHIHRAALLSLLPRQVVETWSERLLVPLISWSLVTCLPIALAHSRWLPAWTAAIGQYLLVHADAYTTIGGHAAVRANVVDDIALARRVKHAGLRTVLADGTRQVSCRMYRTRDDVVGGLSKNLFAAFNHNAGWFVFAWSWLLVVFCLPPILLVNRPDNLLALLSVAISLGLMALPIIRLRLPAELLVTYPAVIAGGAWLAFRSLRLARQGGARWKGRTLPAQRRAS